MTSCSHTRATPRRLVGEVASRPPADLFGLGARGLVIAGSSALLWGVILLTIDALVA